MTKFFAIRNSRTKEFFVQVPMGDRVVICDPSQVGDQFSREHATPFVVTERQLFDLWELIEDGEVELVKDFTHKFERMWVEVPTRGMIAPWEIVELTTGKRVEINDPAVTEDTCVVTWKYYEPDSDDRWFDLRYDLENDPEFSMFAKLSSSGQAWGPKYNPFYPNENPHLRDEFLQEFKAKWGTPG